MILAGEIIRARPTESCRPWPRHVLDAAAWSAMAAALGAEEGLALLALWADAGTVYALFFDAASGTVLPASTAVVENTYPALSPHRPGAAWFERMVADLWGHAANGTRDARPWLDHGRWGMAHPMAGRPGPPAGGSPEPPEFLLAAGEDLHQIPIGPIHGGISEPAHLRVTGHGEAIVRLEVRLGYAHKGTLGLMRGKSPRAASRFAARLSGSTVAHSIAFAHAAEAALEAAAPPRAQALRAAMLELERITNHLGDVGAICDAAGFGLPLARCGLHREAVLRACAVAFGHRLMMDAAVPGGVASDIAPGGAEALLRALAGVTAELPELVRLCEDRASVADRVVGTGIIAPELAARFAAGGVVGRASGRDFDTRRFPGPYDTLGLKVPVLADGDVDARLRVRLAEIAESIRLLRALLAALPEGDLAVPLPVASGEGVGVAEGAGGDIWHWLRLDNGVIAGAFARDPGWAHWPLLEAALSGGVAADVPLVLRSFGASCSGVDL